MNRTVAVTALSLALSSSASVYAQQEPASFSVERFELSLDRNGTLNVESGRVAGHLDWNASLWFGGSHAPLVLTRINEDGRTHGGDIVGFRMGGSLMGSVGLFDLLQVGLIVPVVTYQSRNSDPAGAVGSIPALSVAGVGNIRIAPKVAIVREDEAGIAVALVPTLVLPTISRDAYIGGESFEFAPTVAVSKAFGSLNTNFNVGARVLEQREWLGIDIDDELTASIGASFDLEGLTSVPLGIDASVAAATLLKDPTASTQQNYVEALAGARYRFGPMLAFAAVGAGGGGGYGTPDVRGLLGLRVASANLDPDGDGIEGDDDACPQNAEDYDGFEDKDGCPEADNDGDRFEDAVDGAPNFAEDYDGFEDDDGIPDPDNDADGVEDNRDKCPMDAGSIDNDGCPVFDKDGDGVPDEMDRCVDEAGHVDNRGCPDVDTDGDGIVNRLDRCVDDAEDVDGTDDEDGCPDLDNDGDGVVDARDRCVNEPGPVENNGCPDSDRDGDSVIDRKDNCPDEPGSEENFGCTEEQNVRIESDRIVIMEKIFFDTGKATIQPRSFGLLYNVARVMKDHPEIEHIRVEGHTDNVGGRGFNMLLSQRRALAVVEHLKGAGIAPERLSARGYGFDRGLVDNSTPENRAKNRRVDFAIVRGEEN